MTNYYIPIIYIVPLISVDGQASPRLFIAPEIRHEKISYKDSYRHDRRADSHCCVLKTQCQIVYERLPFVKHTIYTR